MASTYAKKIISGNDTDNGDMVVYVPAATFKDRDIGKDIDMPETLNDRLDNKDYYNN